MGAHHDEALSRVRIKPKTAPRPLVEQVWRPSDTFGVFGTPMFYALFASPRGFGISFDEGDTARWEHLSATDQSRVQIVSLTRDCRCPFCERYRVAILLATEAGLRHGELRGFGGETLAK